MRFSALGDVAMTIPVVYIPVCRSNPATRFIFLTKKSQASLFINPPASLVVLGIDFPKPNILMPTLCGVCSQS